MAFEWFKRLFKKGQTLDLLKQTNEQTNEQTSIELEKESLQLGLAAGYTSRFIQDIHTTLNRIETLIPTKDWLSIQFDNHFKRHEENEEHRLETILHALNSLHNISSKIPEPLRSTVEEQVNVVETQLPLSKRMQTLIQLVKNVGEAPYSDLANQLKLTDSGFRSLLAMTLRRTNSLEKFERDNRKWLRFRKTNSLNEQFNMRSNLDTNSAKEDHSEV